MTILKYFLIVMMGLFITIVDANEIKKYEIKSGKIEYTLSGNGNILGMAEIKLVGKKRVIFDNYGIRNLEEKVEVKKETTMGESKTNKTHTLIYMNDMVLYHVDFKNERITRRENSAAGMGALFSGGSNMKETGEALMKKMGGKKIGSDKVLGYTCDVWSLMGSKQCMYKGIPLKVEMNIMGMKSVEIATKIEFDISLNANSFKLPDFPIYGDSRIPLDKSKLEKIDKIDNAKAKVKIEESAEAMKGLAAGMAALAKSGANMNANELTPDQEKIMQKAMMNAMGGEAIMVEKMKRKMLDDVNSEEMHFAKECFGSADTLKEANSCVDRGNKMFNDDEEYFTSWSKSDKSEMLTGMAEFEKHIPCIKAAQTMDAMKQCMPQE